MNIEVQSEFDPTKVIPVSFSPDCGCNVGNDDLLAQISVNIRRGLPQVQPYSPNGHTALLVCGGPSLQDTESELVDEVWRGGKLVTVNGAYQWCIERNLRPAAAIMLDARRFNARFFETSVSRCKYLLASQCHPDAFDLVEGRETFIWHALGSGSESEVALLDEYYFQQSIETWPEDRKRPRRHYHPVTLGTTVGIRSISLLRMLGFQRIDIFGLDSCWLGEKHHAYTQEENDVDKRISVWLRPDANTAHHFVCSPWHVKQADDFKILLRERGDFFQLSVRGNGLLATMMRTGAELQKEE